jgi:hypothetical protein
MGEYAGLTQTIECLCLVCEEAEPDERSVFSEKLFGYVDGLSKLVRLQYDIGRYF